MAGSDEDQRNLGLIYDEWEATGTRSETPPTEAAFEAFDQGCHSVKRPDEVVQRHEMPAIAVVFGL